MPDSSIRAPDSQVGPPIGLHPSACTINHASLELISDPFQDPTGVCCLEDVSLSDMPPGMAYSEVAVQHKSHRNCS